MEIRHVLPGVLLGRRRPTHTTTLHTLHPVLVQREPATPAALAGPRWLRSNRPKEHKPVLQPKPEVQRRLQRQIRTGEQLAGADIVRRLGKQDPARAQHPPRLLQPALDHFSQRLRRPRRILQPVPPVELLQRRRTPAANADVRRVVRDSVEGLVAVRELTEVDAVTVDVVADQLVRLPVTPSHPFAVRRVQHPVLGAEEPERDDTAGDQFSVRPPRANPNPVGIPQAGRGDGRGVEVGHPPRLSPNTRAAHDERPGLFHDRFHRDNTKVPPHLAGGVTVGFHRDEQRFRPAVADHLQQRRPLLFGWVGHPSRRSR